VIGCCDLGSSGSIGAHAGRKRYWDRLFGKRHRRMQNDLGDDINISINLEFIFLLRLPEFVYG
jgi:hypothetical protein